jgi:tellurium resistance protein TerZ
MAVNLKKGEKISLEKEAGTSLEEVVMGLGWASAKSGFFGSGGSIDLDSSCLIFNEKGKMIDQVWFRKLQSNDRSILHSGDNREGGDGNSDDEQIVVKLNKLPKEASSLLFTVNNYTGQDFSKVKNAYCRLINNKDKKEIAKYDLTCSGGHTAMLMAKVYKHKDEWKLEAIGEVSNGRTFQDMMPLLESYAK